MTISSESLSNRSRQILLRPFGPTSVVDEEEIKVYFGVMLLLGAIAVAVRKVGGVAEVPILDTVALVIILGAALLVSGAVVYSSIRELRTTPADTDTVTAN